MTIAAPRPPDGPYNALPTVTHGIPTPVTRRNSMAEQQHSTPAKSSDEVRKSDARAEAEKSSQGSSGSGANVRSQSQTRANFGKGGDDDRAHPMQGRSLDYSSGPGAEAYTEGMYATDAVLDLPHFAHHKR